MCMRAACAAMARRRGRADESRGMCGYKAVPEDGRNCLNFMRFGSRGRQVPDKRGEGWQCDDIQLISVCDSRLQWRIQDLQTSVYLSVEGKWAHIVKTKCNVFVKLL